MKRPRRPDPPIVPRDTAHHAWAAQLDDLRQRMDPILRTDAGMARFLDSLAGKGKWVYDAKEDVWIITDWAKRKTPDHYIVCTRGITQWFEAYRPGWTPPSG